MDEDRKRLDRRKVRINEGVLVEWIVGYIDGRLAEHLYLISLQFERKRCCYYHVIIYVSYLFANCPAWLSTH